MQDILRIKILEALVEDGQVKENILRDELIGQEYDTRVNKNPDLRKTDLKEQLATKYNISFKSIELAIKKYYERKRKNNSSYLHLISSD